MYTRRRRFDGNSPHLQRLHRIDPEKRSADWIAMVREYSDIGSNRRNVEFTSISECFFEDSSRSPNLPATQRPIGRQRSGQASDPCSSGEVETEESNRST